ncbi:tubulin-tyrosine ligase family-domain-containing protein [Lipomyces kononenkoae]|uniref:Tubulin-tyrosine ligase family-domain-containing protein n=1 Tax=Lipomyces kononenkoae TaxID=34357 RepID=A0ACC3T167_LIPKO
MHVLVTNDDGPPGVDSPFLEYFVDALKKYTSWDISVALPDSQKSWISKAHVIGHTMTASYITPSTTPGQPYEGPYYKKRNNRQDEWALLDGTPASCAQVGIHHLFKEKGPVDLVLSGPNFGRNSSALYILSSGTVGAALEGALCRIPSIATSFAYNSPILEPEHTTTACRLAVRLIKFLYETWPKDGTVDLYSINIPLNAELSDKTKVMYTDIRENRWGSAFEYIEDTVLRSPTGELVEIADQVQPEIEKESGKLQFRWKPNLKAVNMGDMDIPEGSDAWAITQGYVSVTPLKASYQGVAGYTGELKLPTPSLRPPTSFVAVITYSPTSYIYPLLIANLLRLYPNVKIVSDPNDPVMQNGSGVNVFHYTDYEDLNFERLIADREHYFACSYIYRKALIRKNFLAHAIATYKVKHPDTILTKHFPESYELEIDYAEYLDEMLAEIYEFRDQLSEGDNWWILKPSMSDRGQGIRIFRTRDELQKIFESYEQSDDEEEEEEEEEDEDDDDAAVKPISESNGIVTSQVRFFLIQKYIKNPLILESCGNRKFHIRTYVVASGALKVYVYKDMLALFALQPYTPPELDSDLEVHLTNTCLQGNFKDEGSVRRFWSLEGFDKDAVWDQICNITAETFAAAVSLGRLHFQPLPNAFEIYGVDFLVDSALNTSILEVNAYPDFAQTGDDLKELVEGLFKTVLTDIVGPFFKVDDAQQGQTYGSGYQQLALVLDQNISGGW